MLEIKKITKMPNNSIINILFPKIHNNLLVV